MHFSSARQMKEKKFKTEIPVAMTKQIKQKETSEINKYYLKFG